MCRDVNILLICIDPDLVYPGSDQDLLNFSITEFRPGPTSPGSATLFQNFIFYLSYISQVS